jgi:hypothetical protein
MPFSFAGAIGGGGSLNPRTILGANNYLWYKASLGITLNGGDVSAIANQGTGGAVNPAQATAGNQPLFVASAQNGKPCIRFTRANSDILTVASGAPSQKTAHSIFIVAKLNVTSAFFKGFTGIGDGTKSSGIGANGSNAAWFGGANLVNPAGTTLTATPVYVLGKTVATESAGTSATQGYLNGATDGSSANNAYGTSTAFSIGSYDSNGANAADSDVYEVVVANAVASSTQIADLYRYFRAEYAL